MRLAPFLRAHRRGVEKQMNESFGVALNSHHMAVGRASVVVELGTFDDRFEDNVERFFVALAADAKTALLIHSLAGESYLPSCFVAKNKLLLAFV